MNAYLGKMQFLIEEMLESLPKTSYSNRDSLENNLMLLRTQLQDLEAVIERVREAKKHRLIILRDCPKLSTPTQPPNHIIKGRFLEKNQSFHTFPLKREKYKVHLLRASLSSLCPKNFHKCQNIRLYDQKCLENSLRIYFIFRRGVCTINLKWSKPSQQFLETRI